MIVYNSAGIYLQSITTKEGRLAAVEAIIDSLIIAAASATGTSGISEYMLNDGQTQIKGVYRSLPEIQRAIKSFQEIANIYRNQLNGRVSRNVNSKNFRRWQ